MLASVLTHGAGSSYAIDGLCRNRICLCYWNVTVQTGYGIEAASFEQSIWGQKFRNMVDAIEQVRRVNEKKIR